MEVTFCVPNGADITAVEKEYPDIWEDEGWDDHQRYFIGKSSEDDDEDDPDGPISESFLTYEQAVEFCGFAEGAVDGSNCLIEGNGGWAQSQLGRLDFHRVAMSRKEKRHRVKMSRLYLAAKKRGEEATASLSNGMDEGRRTQEIETTTEAL